MTPFLSSLWLRGFGFFVFPSLVLAKGIDFAVTYR